MTPNKCTIAIAALPLLSLPGWRAIRGKQNVELDQTVHLGSAQLTPSDYKMTWTESVSDCRGDVRPRQESDRHVTAQISHVRSGYDGPAVHTDSSNALTEVDLPGCRFRLPVTAVSPTLVSNVRRSADPLRSALYCCQ